MPQLLRAHNAVINAVLAIPGLPSSNGGLVLILPENCKSWWHLYSTHKDFSSCKQNDTIYNTQKVSIPTQQEFEKWRLWPGLMNKFDIETGESIFGYREAMENLWNHQHPADCKNAKFLITHGWDSGFVSEIHVIGLMLARSIGTECDRSESIIATLTGEEKKVV
jgi:hypothetical protein